ncbi:hypothetical protein JZ751_014468 [Albula glossodonta]|uniref:Uncharacterized protein n=1 Tax=Albula glossodonta TaxID=121402 RepID=A0A8T2MY52_9TELE|nr:hypothetical protein JZ751_014468 [Albula glossodonta]
MTQPSVSSLPQSPFQQLSSSQQGPGGQPVWRKICADCIILPETDSDSTSARARSSKSKLTDISHLSPQPNITVSFRSLPAQNNKSRNFPGGFGRLSFLGMCAMRIAEQDRKWEGQRNLCPCVSAMGNQLSPSCSYQQLTARGTDLIHHPVLRHSPHTAPCAETQPSYGTLSHTAPCAETQPSYGTLCRDTALIRHPVLRHRSHTAPCAETQISYALIRYPVLRHSPHTAPCAETQISYALIRYPVLRHSPPSMVGRVFRPGPDAVMGHSAWPSVTALLDSVVTARRMAAHGTSDGRVISEWTSPTLCSLHLSLFPGHMTCPALHPQPQECSSGLTIFHRFTFTF